MKTEFSDLSISESKARELARELYGIRGAAEGLPGEIDMNFKILDQNENSYVLKISRPGTSRDYLEFQQKLLTHLESSAADLLHPRAIPDKKGELVSVYRDGDETRFVRLLSQRVTPEEAMALLKLDDISSLFYQHSDNQNLLCS